MQTRFGYVDRMDGYRWGPEGPPPEAYSRVTDSERCRQLHSHMLSILERLEKTFDVERVEGSDLDDEETDRLKVVRPSMSLTPRDPAAAPISVGFTAFPGLDVRLGRWYKELFPVCGCDACDDSAEDLIDDLDQIVDAVTAGRFREAIHLPRVPFIGEAWQEYEFWSPSGWGTRGGCSMHGFDRLHFSGIFKARRHEIEWKPWIRRSGYRPPPV